MRLPRSFTALLPPRARRVDDAGASTFYVRGRPRLRVHWHAEEGAPCWALELDREGRMHGREREWRADGRLFYEARWDDGVQHGLQRMWRADGVLVVRTRFVRGTGLDAWLPQEGALRAAGETRPFVDGQRHGPERHWESARRVWREEWFSRGVEHGITREWNRTRLARGFPRFFVRGERVDRRAYARACEHDPTLPRWTAREDRPTRARPVVIERGR
ncbi:MAG: hypothetical protein U0234_25025 [Sandaracinus sp.]